MDEPRSNVVPIFVGERLKTANLLLVFKQIAAYKRLEQRKFKLMLDTLRAGHGGQAAPGATSEERPSLPQRQPEAEQ
jgi:hypothetical protein